MHPRPQTVVNERGYAFVLPSLGLPKPLGELVVVQAAIGPKDLGAPAFFYDASKKDERRYPSEGCNALQVEHERAIWTLPLLPPTKNLPTIETFTLQVRRDSPVMMSVKPRLQVPDNVTMFMTVQPAGKPGPGRTPATLKEVENVLAMLPGHMANEVSFWTGIMKAGTYFNPSFLPLFESVLDLPDYGIEATAERRQVDMGPVERQLDWQETPHEAMTQQFMMETVIAAVGVANERKIPVESFSPGSTMRAVRWGNGVRLEYAILTRDDHTPQEDEWLPLPAHAFKPGHEVAFVNQSRQRMGMGTITEEEWQRQRET